MEPFFHDFPWYFCILLLSCNCQDWTALQHKTYRGLAWMAEGLLQGGETLSDAGLRWAQRRTPFFFRESEGLGNSRVGLDHPSGCGRGRLLVDGERWFNGFVPARRFREQLMTASTHMRYMCWSTIRGAPCADQSRTNTILDAAELPTCGYHHAHRKPQPEIEKKHCRTVSS